MRPVDTMAARLALLLILCIVDFGVLLAGYTALRLLRIPVDAVTRVIGSCILALSAAVCLGVILPGLLPRQFNKGGNVVGFLSFFVAVYAVNQWTLRQWYMRVKKRAGTWIMQSSKQALLFVRKHHLFFGWIAAAGAVGHLAFFVPILARLNLYEEITGFIAIGLLGMIILLGLWLWIETALRRRRVPVSVRTIHATLSIAFFVVLFLHI
ncbi:MAG TPA: hypothetical protein VGF67_24430 [Ktedonobacteraceae bacterium]